MGTDGWPLSWRHYQVGLRFLSANDAREALRFYRIGSAVWGDAEDRRAWVQTQRIIGRLN